MPHIARRLALIALCLSLAAGCASFRPESAAKQPAKTAEPPVATAAAPPTPPPPPAPEKPKDRMLLSRESAAQGDVISVVYETIRAEGDTASITAFGQTRPMGPHARGFVALVPVAANATVGNHTISVKVTPSGGSSRESSMTVSVTRREFQVQRLTATPQQTDHIANDKLAADAKKVSTVRATSLPEKQWVSGFQLPLQAKVTTEYGVIRYVNGVETWRHSGIDYGAPQGTEVMACADGVVVLSTMLNASGNTVILDHGVYLFSSYLHLHQIHVKVGDRVKRGQVIGTVGSTGFSTGPHLHWTITVGSTHVDPESVLKYPKHFEFEF